MSVIVPVNAKQLLFSIDEKLMDLLRSLTAEEWELQTIAPKWKVKDIVAHLLDGNIRILSMLRDGYFGETTSDFSYSGMVEFLNGLNADWVRAMKRVSPQMLVFLHELTGPSYCRYYESLNHFDISPFKVDWAGEEKSYNWMQIAREYTEKYIHQLQIREATNRPGITGTEFFEPFMDIFMMALPFTLRNCKESEGTLLQLTLTGEVEKSWFIQLIDNEWKFVGMPSSVSVNQVIIPSSLAWKLFSKSLRPEQIMDKVIIRGNEELSFTALNMISVMA